VRRREVLLAGLAGGLLGQEARAQADVWGKQRGYPTGWSEGFATGTGTRVGNYSGGFEGLLPVNKIAAGATATMLSAKSTGQIHYRHRLFRKTPSEYMESLPLTGLLIARGGDILFEAYGFERTAEMRLTSWSMAKSITGLLLGIALDDKLIDSYDDPAAKYVPGLARTLHGGVTLRNLSNMSSGAEVVHDRDNKVILPAVLLSKSANIKNAVAGWNDQREEQGRTYNYNELCALTLGVVLRQVTGKSLAEYCEEKIWKPIGAEAQATWWTDSAKSECNSIGFGARLRDWARLGLLVANYGEAGGKQIVSRSWIEECCSWGQLDQQVRFGTAGRTFGYKAHMWHARPDGSRPYFNGHHGQRLLIDLPSKTVLVRTAVADDEPWQPELFALFDAVTKL